MGNFFLVRGSSSSKANGVDHAAYPLPSVTLSSLLRMSTTVAFVDALKKINPFRIYLKSHARYRKHGWDGMTSRLVKEYCRATGRPLPSDSNYQDWIELYESQILNRPAVERSVCISVLLPVFNTDEVFLRRAIQSVLGQSYANWELCICDDASTRPHVADLLCEYAKHDSRIRIHTRVTNGHISVATNDTLALASGDFVAFLDHDDELAPFALTEVVRALGPQGDAFALIYSDEDKIDDEGARFSPHFKPNYNPDLILAQNYISHLTVIRRDLVVECGGLRQGYEGSQDHDLLLRCLQRITPERVCHIPAVLYHWRATAFSTAIDPTAKNYTVVSGLQALNDQLKDIDSAAAATALPLSNTYRVRWPLPEKKPMLSLIVPTRDHVETLKQCITSILDKTDYSPFEIIIVNNGSVEPKTLSFFKEIIHDQRIRVLNYDQEFNFSAINNFAVMQARGEVLGLINNDVEVISPGWMAEMVSQAVREEIGCVGAKLFYQDDTIQHAGVVLGLGGVAGHGHKNLPRDDRGYFDRLGVVHNVSAVTAACLFVRKSIYEQVGGMDEENLKVAFNDVDFCLKVREAGYRNLFTPFAELYHFESKSRGADDIPEKKERFSREVLFMKEKWGQALEIDPCYSPHLTCEHEQFQLKSRAELQANSLQSGLT